MHTTRKFSITLPNDVVDAAKSKLAIGEHATESGVIRDGLRAVMAHDLTVENWLRNQVGPTFDAIKADPSRAVTVDRVRARLATEHKAATTKS